MIFDFQGRRKYLTLEERERFIVTAQKLPLPEQTFCLLIAFTGCRISEALELTAGQVDRSMRAVVFRSLKKRRPEPIYRAVPLPDWLLEKLARQSFRLSEGIRLWPWGRSKGWAVIKRAMAESGLSGMHACPKGLRHGFGIAAVQRGVPLNLLQRWLGHAKLETTAIYANAIGAEERRLAERLWAEGKPRQIA
ncbi:tyrosine-type recombinase/integrase [Maricaulis sp. CAU 1757]